MVGLNIKYKANTLMETIIALVIICIVFFMGTDIILKVSKSKVHLQKVEYNLTGHKIINQTILNNAFYDEKLVFDNFLVEKKCTQQNDNEQYVVIKLEFYNNDNEKVYHLSQWVAPEK